MKTLVNTKSMMVLISAIIIVPLAVAAYSRNSIYIDKVHLWENAVMRSPDKQRTHENYGFALSGAGFYEQALKEFDKVLSLNDGSVPMRDVYREIGVVYFRMGKIDEAIMAWQKGLNYAVLDADLMNNIAVAFLNKQDFDSALPYAENSARVNPLRAEPWNIMGEIYMSRGESEKATGYFVRAVELEPDNPSRYWNAALCFEQSGHYEQAYRYIKRFLSMAPDQYSRGQALLVLSQIQQKVMQQKNSGK